MSEQPTFFGITKQTAVTLLLVLAIANAFACLYAVWRVNQFAQQGAQAHAAECAYKHDRQQALDSSLKFLKLTPKQRVHKYGSIGNLPTAAVQSGIQAERSILHALSGLHC